MVQHMAGGLADDEVDGQLAVLRMGERHLPVGRGQAGVEIGVERRERGEGGGGIGTAQRRLADHPGVLVERLRHVAWGRQGHPGAVAERQFRLRQVGQNQPGGPFAGSVAPLEVFVFPRGGERAHPRRGFANGIHGIAVAEHGRIRDYRRHHHIVIVTTVLALRWVPTSSGASFLLR
jgi:hypothetical protein